MDTFKTHTGLVLPLQLKDIDTDMIIPAQYLTSISRTGFGENLFRRLRDQDREFPMNLPKYKNASILVADSNFGCGSSREHAVWALQGAGFKAVIAKSFADIFYSNSAKNGFLLITLPEAVVDAYLERAQIQKLNLTISLLNQTVSDIEGTMHSFAYDPFRKHCILNGLDDLDYILSHKEEIDDYWSSR